MRKQSVKSLWRSKRTPPRASVKMARMKIESPAISFWPSTSTIRAANLILSSILMRLQPISVMTVPKADGRRPNDNEIAVLIRETRADKLIEISTAEVRQRQRKRLSDEEFKTLAVLRAEARTGRLQMTPPADALRHAQEHVFERVSVARAI